MASGAEGKRPQAVRSPRSAAVLGRQNYLRHLVSAQAEFVGYLRRSAPLLVVEQCEPFLRPGPRAAGRRGRRAPRAWPAIGLAGSPGAFRPAARPRDARGGRAEVPAALIMVLARREVLAGAVVEDHEFLGRLVHPDGDHCQALGVLLLALARHAVVVLSRSLGMQFSPARYALRHHLPRYHKPLTSDNATRARIVPARHRHEARLASCRRARPGMP